MKTSSKTLMTLLISLAAGSAFAQVPPPANSADVPGHPRVNQVDQRLANQQQRIQSGVANGKLTAQQAAHDERHDANVAQRESADEARHGGHLSKDEQDRLNQSLNNNSARVKDQKQAPQ